MSAWSSTSRIRIRSPAARRSGPPRRRSGPPYDHRLPTSSGPNGNGEPDHRALRRAGSDLEARADQLGPVAHELEPEVAATSRGHRRRCRSRGRRPATSRVQASSSRWVPTRTWCASACRRTFWSASWMTRRTTTCSSSESRSVGAARSVSIVAPVSARMVVDAVLDRSVEAQLGQERWAQLADEGPHVVQLAPQALPQEAQLRANAAAGPCPGPARCTRPGRSRSPAPAPGRRGSPGPGGRAPPRGPPRAASGGHRRGPARTGPPAGWRRRVP